ncbi:MAG: prephenate dehydrogenase [Flavobacteriaceae bacterium]
MSRKIYIIGIGLIGGSFALEIKKIFPDSNIIGIDNSKENLDQAINLGIIDAIGSIDDITNPFMILLAIPVKSIINILPNILDKSTQDTIVIDFGSTKNSICKSVTNHKNRSNFVAAHPIAGTEFSGPNAAHHGLFDNKNIIICEHEKSNDNIINTALEIFSKMKMIVSYMDSISHDKHIAYVSHLSHLSSFMLGKTVMDEEESEKNIFDMAGSGFESTVRLAKSSPKMWTDIFDDNKANVLKSLSDYINNLELIKDLIESNKFEELESQLKKTNYIKKILKGIN